MDGLDIVDDLVLLSHSHRQMQAKPSELHHKSVQIGLTINKQKTNNEPVTIEGAEQGDKSGGTDTDVKTRIGKA